MQRRMLRYFIAGAALGQEINLSLHVKEIDITRRLRPLLRDSITICQCRNTRDLLVALPITEIGSANLEQAHTFLLTVEVVNQRIEQAAPQTSAHDTHIAGDGVL